MGTVIELHKDMYTRQHVVQRTRIVGLWRTAMFIWEVGLTQFSVGHV